MANLLLKLSCPDRPGLVHKISGFFAARDFNLLEVQQFASSQSRNFFVRMEIGRNGEDLGTGLDSLKEEFSSVAAEIGAEWMIRPKDEKRKVAILCSKEGHCLNDLLWRWDSGDLSFALAGVISNHDTLAEDAERRRAPFVRVGVSKETRDADFAKVEEQLIQWGVDTVVLARYMQIVPSWMCRRWTNRIINIHHSFLPAFAGAQAYRQAHERGVKLIGATCHYVSEILDEGPIIEQEVVRAAHHHDIEGLRRLGRDCEKLVLAKGLRWHLEDRVFCDGNRTIVFSN